MADRQDAPLDVLEDLTDDLSAPVAFTAGDHLERITDRENRRYANDRSGSES